MEHGNQKKAVVTMLTSGKIDFNLKIVIRDKESHCIMIKESVRPENITFANIYAPNREHLNI